MQPTNLIPLLFVRPLRLILPSDTVRRMRIMLLRAVSTPFVALIWCYEGSCRLFGRDAPSPLTRIRSRPLSSNKPSYEPSHSRESGMASAAKSTNLSAHGSLNASVMSPSSIEDKTDLIAIVQKLSAQVDELTAMVAAQKSD